MKIVLLLLTVIAKSSQLDLADCGNGIRRPELTDISVVCGTSTISLAIIMCPVLYTGYNESRLILNGIWDPECRATLDESVDPPVARFVFPLNMTNACGSIFRTTSAPGTGIFSDFSNIQTVNVSGIVQSNDPTIGTVTYNAELKYYYSCAYPLEYLINNTQIDVSSSSIAIKDKNGSFISTLTMELFSDVNYQTKLVIPEEGIELRTQVYVEVKATNLTGQYYVLLDRCYASISPLPDNSTFFNLLVPCSKDDFTTIIMNGESQSARFNFPAFRFTDQRELMVSTFYLHCITRLCEKSTCDTFKQCNINRRRREVVGTPADDISQTYTLTSSEIVTQGEKADLKERPVVVKEKEGSTVGLSVAVAVLAVGCIVAFGAAVVFYKRLRN
ncbi:zona pellucida-like domain-containing protein 1 [Cynoglossus semilaevis]|uniref:zona pellucida-like domain-containing protein 1 n=1 Tax=Cynoglossus semilaevis TaxID=244447 RepID=UPI0004980156|nr:zona pellucida-like domain-containing protein 1 [Cynoglossus semilaevis]